MNKQRSKCRLCTFQTSSDALLNRHMDAAHFDVKPTQLFAPKAGQNHGNEEKKWFECAVCHQRYGHVDGLRYHEQKLQHSRASVRRIEVASSSSSSSGAEHRVLAEDSPVNVLNETIDLESLSQISSHASVFGECGECGQRLMAKQARCAHCEGLFCSKCKTAHVASMKADLEKTLVDLGRGLPKLNKKIDDTYEKRKNALDQTFARVKSDIRSTIKRLVDELRAREERLIKTAEANLAAQMKTIELEKQALKKDVGAVEKYVQLAKTSQFKKNSGAGHDKRVESMTNKLKAFERSLAELGHPKPNRIRFQPVHRKELSSAIKTLGSINGQTECSTPLDASSSASMVSLSFSSAQGSILGRPQAPRTAADLKLRSVAGAGSNWRRTSNAHELVACFRDLDQASRE